jgi:multidrug resistance efflux pump
MHSPLAEVNPEISPPPDPDVKPAGGRKSSWFRRWRLSLIVFSFLALFLGSLALLHRRNQPHTAQSAGQAATFPVAPGALRLKGTTEAVQTRAILAPLIAGEHAGSLTIVKMVPAGTVAKRGDLLVEFDRQAQVRDYIDKQAAQSDLAEKVLEEREKENAARAKDETEIKAAEDDLSRSELEIQKVEILSRIDAEKAQENLEGARATLAQLKQTFDLKRKAAQASIRVLEIQRDRNRETMLHAQANANLMEVHSPLDGIVVLNMIWKEGTMGEAQEGDQVRPGVPFMQVVDPSRMEVQVPVNQADLLSLKVGESATVHLDAYPALVFSGRLETIDPIGRGGDFSEKVETFAAIFSITGHDPRLMPDLSAAIDVATPSGGNSVGGSQ